MGRARVRFSVRGMLAVVCLVALAALSVQAAPDRASAQEEGPATPPPAYPEVGPGTNFLDHDRLLAGRDEKAWYEANIPFVEVPDQQIQDVYYYRWQVHKNALKYTNPEDGFIQSEFLGPVGYSAPDGGISAAAGHHVYEGRWVRDQQYMDDYLEYWLTGPGSGPKTQSDFLNEYTTDWAHQYAFWVADAMYNRAAVTGDWEFAQEHRPQLERQYDRYNPQFNEELGLYWQAPVWDAMEFTASSYQAPDGNAYHGGEGYRPTLNSYQYGDARAIAKLARMDDDAATAAEYEARAADLKSAMNQRLWDPEDGFYKHMMRDENPNNTLLADREEIGFIPWYFDGLAEPGYAPAWEQVMDPQGFYSAYGPTTAERRSPQFMREALNGCCRWNGPSWPYATSQTLTAMANLLTDYPAQDAVTKDDYYTLLQNYAKTQYKNGQPYVAEAHHPDEDRWLYDGRNHSEDYNHSTYTDLVLSGLLGVQPQADDTLRLEPLVPDSWNHFALENMPYHGHNVTVLWDRDGTKYNQGAGMRVYVDGELVERSEGLGPMTINVGQTRPATSERQINDAVNVDGRGTPTAFASYPGPPGLDRVDNVNDGQNFYLDVPNTRWTTYGADNSQQHHVGVDFGLPTPVSDVRMFTYDDGGGVQKPDDYTLQYWSEGEWADVPGVTKSPAQPVGDAMNRMTFPEIETTKIRIVFPARDVAVGVTELQSWSRSDADAELSVEDARPGEPAGRVSTVFTPGAGQAAENVEVDLALPEGWRAEQISPANARASRAAASGGGFETTWSVTPPDGALEVGDDFSAAATAEFGPAADRAQKRTRAEVEVPINLARYGKVGVDDGFDTDTSGDYTLLKPEDGEALPEVAVGGGRLSATGPDRFFGLFDSGLAPRSDESFVAVDPAEFITDAGREDSLFVGYVKDEKNYVGAWYNNRGAASGLDVRVNGQFQNVPDCCTGLQLVPGGRFAVQLDGDTLRSWAQGDRASEWREVRSVTDIPGLDMADPAVREQYRFMFGIRGDGTDAPQEPGTEIAVDRFQALSLGAANGAPQNAEATANPTSGDAPLDVDFTGSASDPDGDELSYSWDFGDGSAVSTERNPSHTYTAPGTYTARLTVSDGRGGEAVDTVEVTVGEPAAPDRTAPTVTGTRPRPGSVTRDARPRIEAKVRDASTDLTAEDVRLFVDGRPVTSFTYNAEDDLLRYVPNRAMKSGTHAVRIVATDAAGNSGTEVWRFEVSERRR